MPDFELIAVRDGAGVPKGARVTDQAVIAEIRADHERVKHFVQVAPMPPTPVPPVSAAAMEG